MRTEENGTTTTAYPDHEKDPQHDFSDFMDGLVSDVKGYVHAERDHLKLQATEKIATLLSKTIRQVMVATLLGAVLLFLSFALAYYLGELFASQPVGFALVAGLYLLLIGAYQLWWSQGGRERSILDHINDLNSDD